MSRSRQSSHLRPTLATYLLTEPRRPSVDHKAKHLKVDGAVAKGKGSLIEGPGKQTDMGGPHAQ